MDSILLTDAGKAGVQPASSTVDLIFKDRENFFFLCLDKNL
jgi:hypothetical protein